MAKSMATSPVQSKRSIACALLLCAAPLFVFAQETSFDGKRWYDVEVSIFTNDVPGGSRSEFPVPHKLDATYLPRLRELASRTRALMITFPDDLVPALVPGMQLVEPEQPVEAEDTVEEPLMTMGPIYSPAVRDAFKLPEFERDPFLDLGTRTAQFAAMNRNIDGSSDHRLLWHKTWRQPLEARVQTPAVFVSGGEQRGGHYELEGSLRVVSNGTAAMLDINVWLNEFRAASGFTVAAQDVQDVQDEWNIPALPFPLETTAVADTALLPAFGETAAGPVAAPAPSWELSAVWQLEQTREMTANQLYYLDHPAIGVLVQIRPYVLPLREPVDGAGDFLD
jgi:hypothetical protein